MSMTPNQKLEAMLTIQVGLNTNSYSTEWIEKGQAQIMDYNCAASQEIGEFLESLPCAWWSGAQQDRQNCVTELVDAYHFIQSQAVIDCAGSSDQALCLLEAAALTRPLPEISTDFVIIKREAKRLKAMLCMNSDIDYFGGFGLARGYLFQFFSLCASYGVTLDLLYARYVGKATLNKFRMANGYKTKQYTKMWLFADTPPDQALKEDNYYLSQWIDQRFSSGHTTTEVDVQVWLTATYANVVNRVANKAK